MTCLVPLGPFATWQAERAIGDHDRSTLRLRLDPQGADGVAQSLSEISAKGRPSPPSH